MGTRLLLVSIVAMVLGLSGCKFSGGGSLASAVDATKKANFGFIGDCDVASGVVQGQMQYHDHGGTWKGYKVAAHGTVEGMVEGPPSPCTVNSPTSITFTGSYEPQPKTLGGGGTFSVTLVDGGERGPTSGDSIRVEFSGGVFDGYVNSGPLQGGNIQQHIEKALK